MSVDKFRFVSPGVQVAEVDRSGLAATAPQIGPAIIGRALYGPGMRPVKLNSTAELHGAFGAPNPGGESGDVWRDGTLAAPTYGLYAADAYLRNNGPVTFVRLMGEASPTANTTTGLAGWTASNAYGLWIANAVSGGAASGGFSSITASLGAVIYTTTGSTVVSLGSISRDQTFTSTDGILVVNDDETTSQGLTFSLGITNYKETSHFTATFNFDPDSDLYIRKVLNTNPQYTNSSIYASADKLNYWLGETFESSLSDTICASRSGAPTALAASNNYAFVFKNTMNGSAVDQADRAWSAGVAKSGYVISQAITSATASFEASDQQKLFRFAGTDTRGDYDNTNLKISIANIKAPVNPTVYGYGTFDVFVRRADDTDNSMEIIESFASVNLDPSSPDYIARRIGDKYLSWNSNEKYYDSFGSYDNISNYIRVDMNDQVDQGSTNASLLPAGFIGPARYIGQTVSAGTGSESAAFAACTIVTGSDSTPYGQTVPDGFSTLVEFPKLVLRLSGSEGVSNVKKAFYGVQPRGTFARRDPGYGDYNIRLSYDLADAYEADGTITVNSFIFTLDDIDGSTTAPYYLSGSRAAGTSVRGTAAYSTLLDAGINNFTMPLVAGTTGFDVVEPDPFANRLTSDKTDDTSYEYYSLRKAVDIIRDPDVVEHNVCSIPGVSTTGITDYLIDMAEERRDTMAVIDIQNDYKPRYELTSGEIGTNRTALPDVATAVSAMKTRGFNTSYGAAYFPAVQIRDRAKGVRLFVPATVAAMAAYGHTDKIAAPWFAPAGFNRGGLSDASSGITATGVSKQLRSQDRDDLYEVNVNPIAQFPQEGVVIFGQKTLQATPSALDRVNVRRLLIFIKKEISRVANSILFQPNVQDTWNRFLAQAEPILDDVRARFGLESYRLILDQDTTTPELVDRNILYARVLLKPARAIEFIAIDFEIFRSGASFDD
jgi:hypothetical protein